MISFALTAKLGYREADLHMQIFGFPLGGSYSLHHQTILLLSALMEGVTCLVYWQKIKSAIMAENREKFVVTT